MGRAMQYKQDEEWRIEPWRESCERLSMNCLVLSDIYTSGFGAKHATAHVSFHRMQPVSDDHKYAEPDLRGLTTADMRFIELLNYLKSEEGQDVGYALLTDASDVQFRKDPVKLMRGMDSAMNTHYLYGSDEWRPRVSMSGKPHGTDTAVLRGVDYWKACFGTEQPEGYSADKFFNCGIVGGHRSILIPFLERMRYWYTKVKEENRFLMCDMFVFSRTIIEDFDEHIVTGYPFHSKFKQVDAGSKAAIYHKSPLSAAAADDKPVELSRNAKTASKSLLEAGGQALRPMVRREESSQSAA
eukprot:TRINITY_DN44264_c0_g1_i1.p1 TRINITY_DN44264_c0_g1~~TRINITY_DN44264_c0_g1_i1.p1  ORF type:complete len:299 (-),score=59.88 TRINITY_DN44264_c0_g1_i1:213-1109(-)